MDYWVNILKCNNNKITFSAFLFLCKERERESVWNKRWSCNISMKYPQPIYTECAEDYTPTTLRLTPPFVLWSSVHLILEHVRLYQVLVFHQPSFIGWWMFSLKQARHFSPDFLRTFPGIKKGTVKSQALWISLGGLHSCTWRSYK